MTLDIETVYNKAKDLDLIKKELEKGHNFLKYGRKGYPYYKHFINEIWLGRKT
jgi:hypothetical protein